MADLTIGIYTVRSRKPSKIMMDRTSLSRWMNMEMYSWLILTILGLMKMTKMITIRRMKKVTR